VRYGRLAYVLAPLTVLLAFAAAGEAQAGCQPTWGVRLSTPQIVSASAGLQIEPGLAGGKVSAGYAIGLLPYAGAGLKLSALRTWGHPLVAKPRQTYVGIEAEATFFIKFSVGVMRRVGGEYSPHRLMLTGGIGLGF
jgi:hypothetical protein